MEHPIRAVLSRPRRVATIWVLYEVFLPHQIREKYARAGDDRGAVERFASFITSDVAIMVARFGWFGCNRFTETREFEIGFAFAIALDATLIESFGAANWWWPRAKQTPISSQQLPRGRSHTQGVRK